MRHRPWAHATFLPAATMTRHGACLRTKSAVLPKICSALGPRGAEDDDLALAALGLLDDRAAGAARARRGARSCARRRARPGCARRRAGGRRARPPRSCSASIGRSSGTTMTRSATIVAPRSAASRAARSIASWPLGPATIGTRMLRYSSAIAGPSRSGARDGLAQRDPEPPPVDRVEDEPGREPAEPRVPRRRVLHDDDEPREPRCRAPPRTANSGQSTPRKRRFGRDAVRLLDRPAACAASGSPTTCAIVNESIAPNAYMRPMKSTLPGSMNRIENDAGEHDQRQPRRLEARMQPPEHAPAAAGSSTSST